MEYRVRKRWVVLGVGTVLVIGYFVIGRCCFQKDHQSYYEVLERASRRVSTSFQAKQQRKGIQKEIWHKKNDQRLQLFLTGSAAELILDKTGEREEIIERITDLKAYIQEELIVDNGESFQKVRYIEADVADYSYAHEILIADRVNTSLYTLPGHVLELPLGDIKPTMSGCAESVEVTFVNQEVNFKAKKFKAEIIKGSR